MDFKDRYVLGVGYPKVTRKAVVFWYWDWLNRQQETNTTRTRRVFLHQPEELDGNCPKYRFVLEKV